MLALGSYARFELCPASDVDLLLVHDDRVPQATVVAAADALWYPLWDAGFTLGHSVRGARQARRAADADLETLTAMLDARVVGGSGVRAGADLVASTRDLAVRRRSAIVDALAGAAERRVERPGRVAEMLEPNLKEGSGGLRDIHALVWAGWALGEPGGLDVLVTRGYLTPDDRQRLADGLVRLLVLRVELQRVTGRRTDVLSLQEQDGVAAALGEASADAMVRSLSETARSVAWIAADTWDRLLAAERGPVGRVARRDRDLAPRVVLRDERVAIVGPEPPTATLLLDAALAAARVRRPFERVSLTALASAPPPTWTTDERDHFLDLVAQGRAAVPVLEALDHAGALERLLPEWSDVRSRPQRNAYHRFTVDRHLLEAVAECAQVLDDPEPSDAGIVEHAHDRALVLLAALLHDIGKGRAEDHSALGARTAETVGARLGLDGDRAATLSWLVRHHLLLADTASRRDLADPATIAHFADAVATKERLALLYVLTIGDSRATGPAAWNLAKAARLRELASRTLAYLEHPERRAEEVTEDPLAPYLGAAEGSPGGVDVQWEDDPSSGMLRCIVVAPDRPGLLASVAGALTLVGLDIVTARVRTLPGGVALERFDGTDPFARLADDGTRAAAGVVVRDAIAGRRDPHADLASRTRPGARPLPPDGGGVTVSFDLDASDRATVVEVHSPDAVGLLARVARVFADRGLDVTGARVQTLGARVVDVFDVRDANGKIIDRAVLDALAAALTQEVAGQ